MAGVPSSAAFVVPALASLFAGALAAAFFRAARVPRRPPPRFCSSMLRAFAAAVQHATGRLGGERRDAPRSPSSFSAR